MVRKHRGEPVERARRREVGEAGRLLREQLAAWASTAGEDLTGARPELPDELNDREQDYWEPLLAIADMAGGAWPELARTTAVHLSAVAAEDTGLLEELLAGIAGAFATVNGAHLSTADLIGSLCSDEEALWRGWWWDDREAKPAKDAPRRLAAKLRALGIRSADVRTEAGVRKGYRADMFEDAFERFSIHRDMSDKGNIGANKQADVADVAHVAPESDMPPDPATAPMDELRAYYGDAELSGRG
jgi:putative DNA primase/helicase